MVKTTSSSSTTTTTTSAYDTRQKRGIKPNLTPTTAATTSATIQQTTTPSLSAGITVPPYQSPFTLSNNSKPQTPMSKSIEATLTDFIKEFNDKFERMRCDFQRQITDLHGLIAQLVDNSSNKQTQLIEKMSTLEKRVDMLERQLHGDSIIIDGVPLSSNESTTAIFESVCSAINIASPSISYIFRAKGNRSNGDSSIIVKLQNGNDRYKLLAAVRSKIKTQQHCLTLKDIGMESNKPIYVHESLTKHNYLIYREALKYKKRRLLSSVFTVNGCVLVKVTTDDAIKPVM